MHSTHNDRFIRWCWHSVASLVTSLFVGNHGNVVLFIEFIFNPKSMKTQFRHTSSDHQFMLFSQNWILGNVKKSDAYKEKKQLLQKKCQIRWRCGIYWRKFHFWKIKKNKNKNANSARPLLATKPGDAEKFSDLSRKETESTMEFTILAKSTGD